MGTGGEASEAPDPCSATLAVHHPTRLPEEAPPPPLSPPAVDGVQRGARQCRLLLHHHAAEAGLAAQEGHHLLQIRSMHLQRRLPHQRPVAACGRGRRRREAGRQAGGVCACSSGAAGGGCRAALPSNRSRQAAAGRPRVPPRLPHAMPHLPRPAAPPALPAPHPP